ncbi:MAG: aquaporin [Anaerolineae bacterium]|nr:aquaporin [Anaerolineae bacterium]NUQ02634.1 aquaporin [Anaerolineae bacterium]
MSESIRASIAEFIGTFMLVFVGIFAAGIAGQQGVAVAALGHGLILVGIAYSFGKISGAHVNPAITVSLLIGGKIKIDRAMYYIVAQLLGAVVAAAVAGVLSGDIVAAGQTKGSLTESAVWTAALFEAVLTFFLATAVWQTAVHGHGGDLAGVAIGLALAGSILAGGVFTGASLNPARTLGPALIAGDLSYVIPYLVGIFAGAIIAALVHGFILTADSK